MKKIIMLVLIVAITLIGCTNTSDAIVQNQNSEVIQLQQVRAQILVRPASTPMELKMKEADLKLVNVQIKQSMETAAQAQDLSNQQNSQKVKNVLGIGAGVVGGALLIDKLTQ